MGVVLLDELQVRQMGHGVGVEGAEGGQERRGGGGRGDPFGRGVVEVLQDDVDTDGGAGPAEAVEEVDGHGLVGAGAGAGVGVAVR